MSTLSTYFSHSWKPTHLPLNLAVWERLSKRCHLLIDQPSQKMREASPPWFINRIEALLRRSDVFIACMPAADRAPNDAQGGDWRLRCSPYLLFEIRLAERADLPRFIVYDIESGFRPGPRRGSHARYVPCRVNELIARLEQGDPDHVFMDQLEEWLTWLDRNVLPRHDRDELKWACLLGNNGNGKGREGLLREAVLSAGFDEPVDLSKGFSRDSDISELFRGLSLLAVDVSSSETLPLYHYAHALMVPSIRLHRHCDDKTDTHLPSLLQGHPAGYQLDTVSLTSPDTTFAEEVARRAASIVRNATPISEIEKGRYELQQRGYKNHLAFISHDSKPGQRALVNEICAACVKLGIEFWEYENQNRSGEHWKNNLDQALAVMTHFVVLLSDTYEHSPMCIKEVQCANSRRDEVRILPFLLGNRQRPNVDLRKVESAHHERLSADNSPTENARKVVENILKHIRR